jgi:hypothetical protein
VDGPVAAHDGDRLVDPGVLGRVQVGDVALDPVDQVPDPADLLLGGRGVDTGPLIDSVDGGGQAFTGAQQVVEVADQVGQVDTSVRKWSQPTQRNRTGHAPPPAATLAGWVHVP